MFVHGGHRREPKANGKLGRRTLRHEVYGFGMEPDSDGRLFPTLKRPRRVGGSHSRSVEARIQGMEAVPNRPSFMDPPMKALWQRMTPLPGDLRLYGGTALALHLDHRSSTAFDFATPAPVVDLEFVAELPWMRGAELRGGSGMVDALVPSRDREVVVTFMECGRLIPMPVRDPVMSPGGIAVAHPIDLIAAKLEACRSRGAGRDYVDVAAALEAWPCWCRDAAATLPRGAADVAHALAAAPSETLRELPQEALRRIRAFARELGREAFGFDR